MHLLFSNEQFLVNGGGVLAGCISGSSSAPTRLHALRPPSDPHWEQCGTELAKSFWASFVKCNCKHFHESRVRFYMTVSQKPITAFQTVDNKYRLIALCCSSLLF